nr:glutaredoxin 3 [Paracoccus yeei]
MTGLPVALGPRAALSFWCPYCRRAKALLTKKGLAFTEVDIEASAENRKAMIDVSGRSTVPQIFINGTHVGGSDELHALDARGGLDQLLAIGRPPVT